MKVKRYKDKDNKDVVGTYSRVRMEGKDGDDGG
jgi:hypothetical protein